MDSYNGCYDLQRYIHLLMAEFKYPFMEKVLKRYASYVIQQAKANLTKDGKGGGDLYNSLTSKSGENKEELFVQFFMEVKTNISKVNSSYSYFRDQDSFKTFKANC